MPEQIEISKKRISQRFCCIAFTLVIISLCACSSIYTVNSPEYVQYKGEINQHVRLIKANKSQVFQALTEEKTFGGVCPDGTIVTHESSPPYGEGTLVKTRINHLVKLEWHSQVEEIVAESRIRLKFLDGFFAGGIEIWELEQDGPYTRISHTITVQPEGLLRKLAWILKFRARHDVMVEAFLDNLDTAVTSHEVKEARVKVTYTP